MTTQKLLAATTAASVLALAGCLDSNPVEPSRPCILNENPAVHVAGDTVRADNGLMHIDLEPGDGATVQASSSTLVCYVAFFPDGQVFDLGGSFTFVPAANQVIPGFAQGVTGMQEGGARRLIVPPELGYGSTPVRDANGNVVIPPNSTLVFDVNVRRVR